VLIDAATLTAFLITTGLVLLLARVFLSLREDPIRNRLSAAARGESEGGEPDQITESLGAQIPLSWGDLGRLDQELRRAGRYKPTARQDFLAFRNLLIILVVLVTGTFAVTIGPERQDIVVRTVIVGLIVAALCWALPRMILRIQGNRRVNRIRRALPDALDMITMCLSGGMSLNDALQHVSEQIVFAHPDLAVELSIVREQSELDSLDLALRQFARRIDADEVVSMTALITQGQKLGIDIVDSMRDYADILREKRRQAADEMASKAGVKLLFPLALFMLPSVFIILWGPAVLELVDFFRNFAERTQ
jgi:tight adherence protein C